MNIGQKNFKPHRIGLKLTRIITAGNKMNPISNQSHSGPVVNNAIKNISNSTDVQNLPMCGTRHDLVVTIPDLAAGGAYAQADMQLLDVAKLSAMQVNSGELKNSTTPASGVVELKRLKFTLIA